VGERRDDRCTRALGSKMMEGRITSIIFNTYSLRTERIESFWIRLGPNIGNINHE
jgi:hypothetical protein